MIERIRSFFARLSERERKLAAITGLVFVAFLVFLFAFLVRMKIGDFTEEGERMTETMRLMAKEEQAFLSRRQQEEADRAKGLTKPVPLRTLIDNIVKDMGVTAPDMNELPDQRHFGGWVEHAVELSVREIGLVNLTKFMEQIEGNRRRFPIAISKLEITKRRRTMDAYDVEMVVSTYEQTNEEAGPGKRQSAAARRGGR